MKKFIHFPFVTALIAAMSFSSCEPSDPTASTPDPVLSSYPRKHLVEEFTSQACGYCPMGMDYVHDFVKNDDRWIVVLHHAGYAKDKLTVSGSVTIANKLKVNGAPSMTIDRRKTNFKDEEGNTASELVFHPAYLTLTPLSQFEEEAHVSVNIHPSYNEKTRELTVRVSGVWVDEQIPDYVTLNVLIKESGMVLGQSDYYHTGNVWKKFTHINAVRRFLTDAEGDEVELDNQDRYSRTFTTTIDEEWVAENCMIVAFLTDGFKPVLQAEQCPVVNGSKGGADIQHGGIE